MNTPSHDEQAATVAPGGGSAEADRTVIFAPPPGAAPPPPPGDAGPLPPPPPAPAAPRRSGLPVVAWVGIGAGVVAVVTAVVLLVLSPWARGGEDPAAERRTAYLSAVAAPLEEIRLSAQKVGTALRDVDGPQDLAPLAELAEGEADRVEAIRGDLQDIGATADMADANAVLVDAAGLHADYLRVLVRAASQPERVAVTLAGRVDAQGVRVADAYRGFHALLPGAVEPLAGVDLSQVEGLLLAIQADPPGEKPDATLGAL